MDTRATLQEAIIAGHTVSLRWIPSHCGQSGNEIAEKSAAECHARASPTYVPFIRSDAATLVIRLGKEDFLYYGPIPHIVIKRLTIFIQT